MGIATDLREAGYLSRFSRGLRRYVNRNRKDDAQQRLIQSLQDFELKNANLERFNPRTQQFDVLQPNPVNEDPFQFNRNTSRDVSGFIESLIGSDVSGQDINLAMDSIDSLINANRPAGIPETKYSKYGQNVYQKSAGGEIDFEDPAYTIPGDETTTETKYSKYGRNVYEVGPDGEVDFTKPAYTVPKEKGKEDEQPDYSKLIGDVTKGIEQIKNLTSTAKFNGDKVSVTIGTDHYPDLSKEQYNSIKEGIKNRYKGSAIQLLNQQGLDEAVEDVRQLIGVEGSLDKALSKFMELNGDQFNDEDLRILRDYFTLMSL